MKYLLSLVILLTLISCQPKEDTQQSSEATAAEQKESTAAPKPCTKELKRCPDGSVVGRDSDNQCQFANCPDTGKPPEYKTVKGCTRDLRQCPDGSSVGRDPERGCEFALCPGEDEKQAPNGCTLDVKVCDNGKTVVRDANNHCEFEPCTPVKPGYEQPVMCTQDVKQCPDGSYVGRDSRNGDVVQPAVVVRIHPLIIVTR